MDRPGRRRVSPALAISIVALAVAVVGTPAAGAAIGFIAKAVGLTGTQKKQVTKIADQEIKKKSGGLSVKFATNSTTAAHATSASSASTAASATTANGLSPTAASAFFPSSRVFSFSKTIANTGTSATPTTVGTIGPFTVQATCTLTTGTLQLNFTVAYPANTVFNETLASSAGSTPLDTVSNSGTTFSSDASAAGDFASTPLTLITPTGTPYQILEGWDGLNFPRAGSCAVQLLAVQG